MEQVIYDRQREKIETMEDIYSCSQSSQPTGENQQFKEEEERLRCECYRVNLQQNSAAAPVLMFIACQRHPSYLEFVAYMSFKSTLNYL